MQIEASEPGQGATFKVYLPADARSVDETGPSLEPEPVGGNETILVAEDQATVRSTVVQILRRSGYRPLEASNGAEAIRVLKEHEGNVHLALLDVVMPELDGPEAWEHLKKQHPDLKVLFASGYADNRHAARLPPGTRLLGKPFHAKELLRRLREALDE